MLAGSAILHLGHSLQEEGFSLLEEVVTNLSTWTDGITMVCEKGIRLNLMKNLSRRNFLSPRNPLEAVSNLCRSHSSF